jgi:hypothetical protein
MNFQKFALIVLLIFSGKISFCQEDSLKSIVKRSSNLKISFNSSLIYPGTDVGIETPIAENYITKLSKTGDKKEFIRSQFLTANLSWYHHPNFHDNVYITFGWTNRRTRAKGLVTDFSPGIGYSRTFLGGTTYKVNDQGEATIKKLAGYSYALILIGGGVGYDFSVVKSKPFMISYKLNLLTMFPYNSTIYLRPTMEIVLIYRPPHFLPVKVKINRKNK